MKATGTYGELLQSGINLELYLGASTDTPEIDDEQEENVEDSVKTEIDAPPSTQASESERVSVLEQQSVEVEQADAQKSHNEEKPVTVNEKEGAGALITKEEKKEGDVS